VFDGEPLAPPDPDPEQVALTIDAAHQTIGQRRSNSYDGNAAQINGQRRSNSYDGNAANPNQRSSNRSNRSSAQSNPLSISYGHDDSMKEVRAPLPPPSTPTPGRLAADA